MTGPRFGYGTNGFGDHRLDDALAVIADLGYEGVALTLDVHHHDPFAPGLARRTAALARRLDALGLAVVVETGARYLLDARHKHRPTLLDAGPARALRMSYLRTAVAVGADLGAEAVSFWSGGLPSAVEVDTAWRRLAEGAADLTAYAAERGVPLGIEPEPGMLLDDLAAYQRLRAELGDHGPGLTLDIGHCRCLEAEPVPDCVRRAAPHLVTVQIEDMRRGVHEHREFGDGEIDFPPVLAALATAGYAGLVSVELPRHGHAAPAVAERSLAALRAAWAATAPAAAEVAA